MLVKDAIKFLRDSFNKDEHIALVVYSKDDLIQALDIWEECQSKQITEESLNQALDKLEGEFPNEQLYEIARTILKI